MAKTDADHFKDVHKSIDYRGRVLHHFSNFDMIFSSYLARHFAGLDENKYLDLLLYVFGDERMSFKSKLDAFIGITKRDDKAWYKAYPATFKDMKADLTFIMEQRNILAHRMMDLDMFIKDLPDLKNSITLVKFKDSVGKQEYNNESIIQLIGIIIKLSAYFVEKFRSMLPSDSTTAGGAKSS